MQNLDYKKLLNFSKIEPIVKENYTEKDILSGKLSEKDKTQMIINKILENNGISAICKNIISNRSSSVYEFQLNGYSVKFQKIKNLTDTFKMYLHTENVIVEQAKTFSGFSISIGNKHKSILTLGDCYHDKFSRTCVPIGVDIYNQTIETDLATLPHLMICGSTGSGKSVCLNDLICSLLINNKPEEVQFILIDPKQVEFAPYRQLQNYCQQGVISEVNIASNLLSQLCSLMDRRYIDFQNKGVLDINSFNVKNSRYYKYYRIFVFIDELADLMFLQRKEVETPLCRLAQMGRAAGIHLVLATQRPSREIITGILKVNIPAKICFKVPSTVNSRIVLDQNGAESLSGNGDGLWLNGKTTTPIRFQSPYISTTEIQRIVEEAKHC